MALGRDLSFVNINRVAERLKSVEGNPNRQENGKRLDPPGAAEFLANGVGNVREESPILERE